MNNWKQTKIWKRLEEYHSEEAENVRGFLISPSVMQNIQSILFAGGTSPLDFTLHDADHSFRVAERIWELIPDETKKALSEYELALLLLSAYLHDIGMTPTFGEISNLFRLLSGDKAVSVLQEEKVEFQKWLDENDEQINIEEDTIEDSTKRSILVTHYIRHRHNDWSEKWIENNLKDEPFGKYGNWKNDLINICKSHHYGLEELKGKQYDPLLIDNKLIHRRFIAMCLRLADVIEISPKRAPIALLSHRAVSKESVIHWLKEYCISISIMRETIVLSGWPKNAKLHKIILDIANQIESETYLCNILIADKPLNSLPFTISAHYQWQISPSIIRRIEQGNEYEFIEGSFKPNTKKLLEILAGTQLYNKPIVAVRELLQNAFDAVKVQIGYQVRAANSAEVNFVNNIKEQLKVSIHIKKEANRYWLECIDNGCGMTKDIILNNLLVSGQSKRHELLELERACNHLNYNLELTANFGIGALSYFMIADKVIVETKSATEPTGWEFEIDGLSDFGELRKSKISINGTKVRLRLHNSMIESELSELNLKKYLQEILIRLPTNFSFHFLGKELFNFLPGWCRNQNHFIERIENNINKRDYLEKPQEFSSQKEIDAKLRWEEKLLQLKGLIRDRVYFIQHEGKLPENQGYYRISIPLFKNAAGISFLLLFDKQLKNRITTETMRKELAYMPMSDNVGSCDKAWKGIKASSYGGIHLKLFKDFSVFLEVDLTDSKSHKISVARDRLSEIIKTNENKIEDFISQSAYDFLMRNFCEWGESPYALINMCALNYGNQHRTTIFLKPENINNGNSLKQNIYFPTFKNEIQSIQKVELSCINNKAIVFELDDYEELRNEKTIYKDQPVLKLDSFPILIGSFSRFSDNCAISPHISLVSLDHLVYRPDLNEQFCFSFISNNIFKSINRLNFIGNSADFPPNWSNLFCTTQRRIIYSNTIFNRAHQYFHLIDKDAFEFIQQFFKDKKSIESDLGKDIISSKAKCLAFIIYLINGYDGEEYWLGLIRSNPQFIKDIWSNLFNDQNYKLLFLKGSFVSELVIVSSKNWEVFDDNKTVKSYFPPPKEEEWLLRHQGGVSFIEEEDSIFYKKT